MSGAGRPWCPSLPAGCGVLVACQGPAAELLLVELPPSAAWRACPSIAVILVCAPPLPLILCQIQHSSSRRKTWDVFPIARELYVGVSKVSKEQALGVRGLLRSLGPAYPRNTLLAWPLLAPAGWVFGAGPTAVAELSRAAHAQRQAQSSVLTNLASPPLFFFHFFPL